MDVGKNDEEIAQQKREKKKHKRDKEKEALTSEEVPAEKKKKHKKNKEKQDLSSSEVPREKKKHKKSEEKMDLSSSEVPRDVGGEKEVAGYGEKEGVSDMECMNSSDQELEKGTGHTDGGGEENFERVKKGKGKTKNCIEKSSKKRQREEDVVDVEIGEGKKKKKKKRAKLDANIENTKASSEDVEKENNIGSTNEYLRNSDSQKSSKRVKFASQAVFPSSDDEKENSGKELIRGKRFTKEEDQIIIDAINNYIEAHKLGEEGLDMLLHCRKHPNVKYCWREIGLALPYRPSDAIYQRGTILLTRSESRRWTEDEKAFVLKFYEKHGPDWKSLAQILGKNRHHVRMVWRFIRCSGKINGRWSQTEYQSLFNLVNKNLRMLVFEERYSKHGLIRDNIGWTAISECLATRTEMSCCRKWYKQLSSSVVKDGICLWADKDDYQLLNELIKLDACCVEDVDWDNLLEHRSGDICLKRWRQMVNHIGEHGLHSFAEQVEVLAKRYCPELLEVREALDSRPLVD